MRIFFRYISILITCVFSSSIIYAVPAYPYKVKVVTENGKEVEIFMRGDENNKYACTLDGYTLLSDSVGWWYATLSEKGDVKKTSLSLMSFEDETEEIRQFKSNCKKNISPYISNSGINNTGEVLRRTASNAYLTGERRALVVLIQFKDLSFKKTADDFVSLFNDLNYNIDGATGSVRDYYRFASQGQFDYLTDVYGPYTSKNNMSYYGGNSSIGGNDAHAVDLCKEAMMSLPKTIDYSIYDNDDDGLIDNVHIIFAGYGEEAGASSNAIWSHEYPHRINLVNEIGYSLAGYSCTPELRGNRGSKISNIGVVCHELGHALGAMDYYDTNYGTGGEYEGTGKWDIMAGGSWNDDGRTPPNFNPYVRSEIFGWSKQVILESDQIVSMPRMEIDNEDQSVVYRVNTGSTGDYFLLENRQLYGFDAALPGEGLMIYHVHPNINRMRNTNTINSTHPQGLYPVCASYSEPNKKKYGNINSRECPFPGSKNIVSFTPTTNPAAIAWNGSPAQISLSSIKSNSDGSISFLASKENIIGPIDPDNPTEKNLVFKESFESDVSERLSITSVIGKEKWRKYKKGIFVTNADMIPEASDGTSILMLFSGKDNTRSESEADGQKIMVEPGKNYSLSFDYYCLSIAGSTPPSLSLYVEDKYGEYKIYSTNSSTDKWNTIEIPLVFADSLINYKLYGVIRSGGIFIDNLKMYKEEEGIDNSIIDIYSKEKNEYFRIDGLPVDSKRGFFLIRKSDGRTYKVFLR
jgi:M6 family metalloprotease-like protein